MNFGGLWGWIGEAGYFRFSFYLFPHTQTKNVHSPLHGNTSFPGTSPHLLSHRSESVIYPSVRPKRKRTRWSGWLSGWTSTKQKQENVRKRERERDTEEAEWCLCVWLQSMRSPRQLCLSAPNCRQVRQKWQKKGQTLERERDKERQLACLTVSEIRHITRMTVQVAS